MEPKFTATDDQSSEVADDQYSYEDDEGDFELTGYLDDLHSQHEGSLSAEMHSMDDSPEASVVRYSFWSIM